MIFFNYIHVWFKRGEFKISLSFYPYNLIILASFKSIDFLISAAFNA